MFGIQMGRMGGVGQMPLAQRIAYMFSNSEPGAWYDPSDLPTLFQDTAGTTPVTAVEQTVALMLDKSGRGNHASQATSTKRFRYSRRINLLVGSTTLATQSITTQAAGYKIVFSGTGSVTLSGTATGVYGAGTNSITCTAGTLTLTVSGSVQDASFHLLTDSHLVYQWVNTDTDYDADPAKFPAYLRLDGVDDALQTGNIDFTGTDKMTVWAGVSRIANGGIPIELSTAVGSNAGSFYFFAGDRGSAAGARWTISSRGSAVDNANQAVETAANYNAPLTNVVTGAFDISGDSTILRINGGQIGSATGDQGTGNYGNYPLYIGARAGTQLYYNGRLYGLIMRGAQSSLSQIEATELYMKQKMRLP